MAEGVERMDELFTRALAAGVFVHDSSLDIPLPPPPVEEEAEADVAKPTDAAVRLPLYISASDGTTLTNALGQIRSINGVQSIGESDSGALIVTYRGDLGALRGALARGGWTVDLSGGVLRISRGAASAPPAAPSPAPPAPPPAAAPPPAPAATP